MTRDDFSEVYLFFDYDAHQTNLRKEDDADAVAQMLESFDNETENGKLYISYPMVEALRDYKPGICGDRTGCFVANTDMKEYKNTSATRSDNPRFKEYGFQIWNDIIDVFAMRVSGLFESADTIEYEHYSETISPYEVYEYEKKTQVGSNLRNSIAHGFMEPGNSLIGLYFLGFIIKFLSWYSINCWEERKTIVTEKKACSTGEGG